MTWTLWARPLWLGLGLYSTVFRLKLGIVPPLAVIKLHEHLSFFKQQVPPHLVRADRLSRTRLRGDPGLIFFWSWRGC
jgi:hypothetical protein